MMTSSAASPLFVSIKHAKEVVDECLPDGPSEPLFDSSALEDRLNPVLFAVLSAGRSNASKELPEQLRIDLWHIVCKLWNACVVKHNETNKSDQWMVTLRESASDLLTLIRDADLSIEERATKATFYHKIGCAQFRLEEYEAAEASFGKAHEYSVSLHKDLQQPGTPEDLFKEFTDDFCSLLIHRAKNAWQLQQWDLAKDMLASAADVAQQQFLPSRQRFFLIQSVIITLLEQGTLLLEAKNADALGLLDNSYNLITGHLELDEDDENFEMYQKEACDLQAQVLRLLAQAYLLKGKAATALQCVHNLRKLQEEYASQPAVFLTAIQALTMMGQRDEAEVELLALAAHREASIQICMEALSAILDASCGAESLRTAASLLINRFPQETYVPVKVVEIIMGQKGEDVNKDHGGVALQIISDENIVDMLTKDDAQAKEHRKALYIMLWNHGTHLFTKKSYTACSEFYKAALMYADDSAKPMVARQLALAHMATQNLDRALEYLAIALQLEPGSIYSIFVKIKVLLMKGAADEAVDELQNLLACEEFNLDFLRVICTEAMSANVVHVAKEALLCLYERATAVKEGHKPGEEAAVLRNLIKITADDADGYDLATAPCAPPAAVTDAQLELEGMPDAAPVHTELCGHYSKAEQRLEAVGYSRFFGNENAEVEWFANSAFNAGLAAAKSEDHMSAAVLFGAAGSFYGAFRQANTRSIATRMDAFAVAASCALEAHMKHPDHRPSLSLAQHMLQQAQATADAIKALPHTIMTSCEDHFKKIALHLLKMEFDIATRKGDEALQLSVLEKCKAAASFMAEDFLEFANLCRHSRYNVPSVAKAAFKEGLKALLAQGISSKEAILAQTIRSIMELSSDAEKLSLISDTRKVLSSLQPGTYPRRELAWLLTTTWNRGCHHAKYRRLQEAQQFMDAALSLVGFCPEFQARQEELAQELKRVIDLQKTSAAMAVD